LLTRPSFAEAALRDIVAQTNLTSLNLFFRPARARRLANWLVHTYGLNARVPILAMRQSVDGDVRDLADLIYRKMFLNYTIKQMESDAGPAGRRRHGGCRSSSATTIDTFGTGIRPCRTQDTNAVQQIVARWRHYRSHVRGVFLHRVGHYLWPDCVHGAIDAFFAYDLGALPYRSVSFGFERIGSNSRQPVATINYPNTMAFTRVTDQSHLAGQHLRFSLLTREYLRPHISGLTEPF
jgi:UDP-galactopyranose mutase